MTFTRMREMMASNVELSKKLNNLERKLSGHDQAVTGLIHAIRELAKPPDKENRKIGFKVEEGHVSYGSSDYRLTMDDLPDLQETRGPHRTYLTIDHIWENGFPITSGMTEENHWVKGTVPA